MNMTFNNVDKADRSAVIILDNEDQCEMDL